MLRRFSKRGGTELREIRSDLGIIEIGSGIRQRLAHLLTKLAVVSLAVAHELERKHAFVGRARQQDPHGSDRQTRVLQIPQVAFSFSPALMRVWTRAFEA